MEKSRLSNFYVGMPPTCPLSLNNCNSSELSNTAAISPFRNIKWPTSISRHDNTLKGGKIHRYNDICEIVKTAISPSFSSVNRHNCLNIYLHFCTIGFFLASAVPLTKKTLENTTKCHAYGTFCALFCNIESMCAYILFLWLYHRVDFLCRDSTL